MAEEPELTVVAGPHSVGVTLHLVGDVTIYIGMPPPEGYDRLTAQDAERHACRNAARALRAALEELEAFARADVDPARAN